MSYSSFRSAFVDINRMPAFIPKDDPNIHYNVRDEIGRVQKRLLHWVYVSNFWGPRLWYYMHRTAAEYKKTGVYTGNQIQSLVQWLTDVPLVLPCQKCKYWYRKYIIREDQNRFYTICSDPSLFFDYVLDMHNRINFKLNKPILPYTSEEAYEFYSTFY